MLHKVTSLSLTVFTFSLICFFSLSNLFLSGSINSISKVSHAAYPTFVHAVQEQDNLPKPDRPNIISSLHLQAVLLPDWEVLLLLPSRPTFLIHAHANLTCHFHNGASSSAQLNGTIPSSGRIAFSCIVPQSVRPLRPLLSPRLVSSNGSDVSNFHYNSDSSSLEMIRWNQIVYDSMSTSEDVILFAKGINKRAGSNFSPSEIRCIYLSVDDTCLADRVANSSAQEVFRCPHPTSLNSELSVNSLIVKVSLVIGTSMIPVPSLANYNPPSVMLQDTTNELSLSLMCACTMVYNVAKFLREWVIYHTSIGIQKFLLYDNGSDDELGPTVRRLLDEGYDVATYYWPWPKTQEAGFSHCAAVNLPNCQWMAFFDVDEFFFSPSWADSMRPDSTMLTSLVKSVGPEVGQVSINCYEFGPSRRVTHPQSGVTQGYTCRRKSMQRHKSIVRLKAVDSSLVNVIHHFGLKEGFQTKKLGIMIRVNHYKYQVWDEFKMKFRRRPTAYYVDWTTQLNADSKDRTPGLGFEPVEPTRWVDMFCEVNDTLLRDVTRKWFGLPRSSEGYKLAWESIE